MLISLQPFCNCLGALGFKVDCAVEVILVPNGYNSASRHMDMITAQVFCETQCNGLDPFSFEARSVCCICRIDNPALILHNSTVRIEEKAKRPCGSICKKGIGNN